MPLPLGFVPPCLPTKAPQPPTGEAWLRGGGLGPMIEGKSRTP